MTKELSEAIMMKPKAKNCEMALENFFFSSQKS